VSRGPGRPHAEDDVQRAPLLEPLKHALQETDFEVPEAFRESPSFSNIPELRRGRVEKQKDEDRICAASDHVHLSDLGCLQHVVIGTAVLHRRIVGHCVGVHVYL
jgi:hypothetical protein